MFCYQCEQTVNCVGCTKVGVCGKDAQTADLQDVLVHVLKGIANYAHRARKYGKKDERIDVFMLEAFFSTLTNVNFDPDRMVEFIREARELKAKAKRMYEEAARETGDTPASPGAVAEWDPGDTKEEMLARAHEASIPARKDKYGDTIIGLQEMITYGIKGIAAYADHAHILGKEDDTIYSYIHEALDYMTKEEQSVDELFNLAMKCGAINLRTMEILDDANTSSYGHPEPTRVRITPVKGKAILVSGHDLKDLEELLKQTEGKGINIYTHGEMLPCNAYPGLKKYKHLVGNYGGAWQDQQKEFEAFPGAILMTTNCIQKPRDSYKHRIFTSGVVGWPGVVHIKDRNFAPVIEAALAEPGFQEDAPEKYITIGFARNTVLSVADKVIDLVKQGKIRHFFLIGGCDGAAPKRNYYTRLAESVPSDCVILTLGCGKYRFNKMEFGEIEGIPRLLDMGQCNDAYSAIQVAVALAKAFDTDVNSLPLSMIISWFEQKAVAILLTLLHLGIKKIKLGPRLPAFITPEVLDVLVQKFEIAPVKTPEEDLAEILGQAS